MVSPNLRFEDFPPQKLKRVRCLTALMRLPQHAGMLEQLVERYDFSKNEGQIKSLVTKIAEWNPIPFDPYIMGGFQPNENQLTDALARILDPNGGHGLGTLGIRALLGAVRDDKRAVACEILRCLSESSRIQIFREYYHEWGRLDLKIVSSKFVIILENKSWGGSETIVDGVSQTVRYEQLLDRAEREGQKALGIFLTPEGKSARSPRFTPVECAMLARCLIQKIEQTAAGDGAEANSRAMIRAFAQTYAWIN